MSRSRRRTPKAGITTSESEKEDKRTANRRFRRLVRRRLHVEPEADLLPVLDDVSNIWWMAKDGKRWFGHPASTPSSARDMRK